MRLRFSPLLPVLFLVAGGLMVLPGEASAAPLTFVPIADATVTSNQATKNFGRTTTVAVKQSAAATSRSYLTFTVAGVTGAITSVRLRLNVTDVSGDGGQINPVAGSWAESTITWANAPAIGGTSVGVVGAVTAKGWRDVTLDPVAITGNGTYSFAITAGSTDQAAYSSRETTKAPQLVVELAGNPSPSPVPTPSPSPTPTPTATPSPTPSPTPTPSPSPTPTPTLDPTPIPTPTPTLDPGPTAEPTPDPTLSPTIDPGPTAAPTPDPSPSPTIDPGPTPAPTPDAAPSPDPTAAPAPTATTQPTATPDPLPTTPPPVLDPSLSRSLLISNTQLMTLPTSGTPWTKLATDATGVWPALDPSNQDSKLARFVVAGALYAARTGDPVIRDRVVATLQALVAGPWYTNMLALARQLSGYVIAADLIGYRDPAFVAWVDAARTRIVDPLKRWNTLDFTAANTTGNWGTWSLAALTAADLYLGDSAGINRDWAMFAGYGVPFATGWTEGPFIKTAAWKQGWSSVASDGSRQLPIGLDINGTLVEDASRSAGMTIDATGAMYLFESVRAITTTNLLFKQAGFDVAGVTDGQLRRLVAWLRATPYADSIDGTLWGFVGYGLSSWSRFALNHLLGTGYPTNTPTNTDRHLGYTDWLWPA